MKVLKKLKPDLDLLQLLALNGNLERVVGLAIVIIFHIMANRVLLSDWVASNAALLSRIFGHRFLSEQS